MDGIRNAWRQSGKYILAFLGIVLLIMMISDFNRRSAEARRLKIERDNVRTEVTQLAATNQYLETRIAYATSDEAVYEWARQQGHMAQPGDNPVVVVAPVGGTLLATPTVAVTPQVVQNWQVWYALFIDASEQ